MRKLLAAGLFGVAAIILAAGGAATAGLQPPPPKGEKEPPPPRHGPHEKHMTDCAKECGACALECDMCAAHCGRMLAEGKKEHHKTLATCQDCASICAAAACVTGKGGPFADLICTACAEACKRCGEACDQLKDDEHMAKCAAACRKCEKACRDMLAHAGHGR